MCWNEEFRIRIINAAVLFATLLVVSSKAAQKLHGLECRDNEDCNNSLHGEQRSTSTATCVQGRCSCPPYHLFVNGTTCLPGRLLGFRCDTDAQCRVRVPMSGCVQGVCQCSEGYTPYRRSNCLKGVKVGRTCRTQGQCRSSSPHSYCLFSVPRVMGHCECTPEYVPTAEGLCVARNLGLGSPCSSSRQCNLRVRGSLCRVSTSLGPNDVLHTPLLQERTKSSSPFAESLKRLDLNTGTCQCPRGHLAEDSKCIPVGKEIGESPVSLGQRCTRHAQCEAADPHSHCSTNGVCDCVMSSTRCSARNTGCHPDTFQCVSSGKCISSHFVCDGTPQCEDSSDEAMCHGGRCSPHSFRCPSGSCISRGLLCDGRQDCEDGADEYNCEQVTLPKHHSLVCPPHSNTSPSTGVGAPHDHSSIQHMRLCV